MRTAQSPKRTLMEFLQTAYDAATDPRSMGSFRAGIDGRPRTTAIGLGKPASRVATACVQILARLVCPSF